MNRTKRTEAMALSATLLGCAALFGCAGAAPAPQTASDTAAVAGAGAPSLLGSEARAARGEHCTTIRRGGTGDAHDTRVAERWPDRSYGAESAAFTGKIAGASRAMLVGFDLGALPRDARITWAMVSVHALTCATCASQSVTAHRVTAAWDERTSTWESFGGAYDSQAFANASRHDGESGEVSFEVTGLVREWVNGAQPNRGIILVQDTGTTSFTTSESDSPGLRPRLDVCYDMGSSAPGAGHARREP